jgi:YHS domain-containing protein
MAATCPVCKMEVEEKKARGTTEYKGKAFYFCCKACKKKFDETPDKYVAEKK